MLDYGLLNEKVDKFLEDLNEYQLDLVKSKERVSDAGEVFTPKWVVTDMLNMDGIKEYSYELDKTFLEPSCGNGNFLIQMIIRKLLMCKPETFDIDTLEAVGTIYGVDIAEDNIRESRERMYRAVEHNYKINNREFTQQMREAVLFILCRNIILGNTLESKKLVEDNTTKNRFLEDIFGESINAGYTPIQLKKLKKAGKTPHIELLDNREYLETSIEDLMMSEWNFDRIDNTVQRVERPFKDLETEDDLTCKRYEKISIYELGKLGDIEDDDEFVI